ncbi:MAG: hypothetical protein N2B06_14110 [Clostridium sp.]
MNKILRNIFVIAIVSTIFQAVWEYSQCSIFFTMDDLSNNTRLMFSATFGDVIMTLALYSLLSFVNGELEWFVKKWDRTEWVIMILYALFLSFYFEISALHNGRWGYSENMPLFPNTNIALIPVVQLLILFPLSFWVSKHILTHFNKVR